MLQRKRHRPELSQRAFSSPQGIFPFYRGFSTGTPYGPTVVKRWIHRGRHHGWDLLLSVLPTVMLFSWKYRLQTRWNTSRKLQHNRLGSGAWLVTFICEFCTMLLSYSGSLHMACGPAPSNSLPTGCAMLHRWTDGQMNPEHWSQVSTMA